MKKHTHTIVLAGASLLLSTIEAAAQKKALPPDCGTWQLVSNVRTPKSVSLQFYNNDGILMYEEVLEGRRLNPDRKKVAAQLNNTLVEAHQTWMKDRYATLGQKDLFSKRLKPKNGARFASANQ